jgi:hypothetical protein
MALYKADMLCLTTNTVSKGEQRRHKFKKQDCFTFMNIKMGRKAGLFTQRIMIHKISKHPAT